MSANTFVDTNVLVYTRDASEPRKQKQAEAWMHYLWQTRTGRLSFQVLQEFYVTVTEKLSPGLTPAKAKEDVQSLFTWTPTPIDQPVMEGAWRIQSRFKIAWWYSLIISAARQAGCRYLLTEDLKEGQDFGGVCVVSPFAQSPADVFNDTVS
jgi:predicted nucleic acid-binding protein